MTESAWDSFWARPRARLILGSLLAIATVAATIQPVRSYDLWWHLATGRLMASEGRIPDADPFSFTRAGTDWLDHEWLFQHLAYQGYRVAEWRLLLPGTAAIGLGTYLLLALCLLRRAREASTGWLLLALSLAGGRFRFDFRPEMLSYFFLAAVFAILEGSRHEKPPRLAWLLFPLFALWANVHPAALLGAASVFSWLAGEWIQLRLERRPAPIRSRRLWIALGSPLALLLNPGGWRLMMVPIEIRRIVTSGHAPNREWLRPQWQDFPLFFGSVALGLLVLVVPICSSLVSSLLAKRRRAHGLQWMVPSHEEGVGGALRCALATIDWAPTLVLGLMTWMAYQQLRNIGFFFLILPLALARPMSLLLEKGRVPAWAAGALGGVVLVLLTPVFLRGAPSWSEESLLAQVAPDKAIRFLHEHRVGKRLFNDVKFGGYLIWKRYPEYRVFIDGRNEIYDPLLKTIFAALGDWKGWEAMLDGFQIDAAMLRRGQVQKVEYPSATAGVMPRREDRAFSAAYFQRSSWALVYWDDRSLIFVRRGDPAYAGLLKEEYQVVNPDDTPHLAQAIRSGQVQVEEAMREVDRKLGEDPRCETALALRRQLESLKANPSY